MYLLPLILMTIFGYFLIMDDYTINNSEKIFYYGLSATTTLLGFLISGFAIFAALSDRDLVYIMKKIPASNSELGSYYDQTQIYFFEPFIFLGITCSVSFIGAWLLMIWPVTVNLIPIIAEYKSCFCVIYGFYLYLFFLSFISIKDFIFNIFQIGKLYSGFEAARPDINDVVKKMADIMVENSHKNTE